MRESRSYGSVGERGGNEPLYPEQLTTDNFFYSTPVEQKKESEPITLFRNLKIMKPQKKTS